MKMGDFNFEAANRTTTRVFVLVYALDTGRFLSILRADDRTWGLPGGKVEMDEQENPDDAIWRETIEEVGINLQNPKAIHDMPVKESENCKIYLEVIPTACPVTMNESEVAAVRWSFLEEWPTPAHPGMTQLIREAIRHISTTTFRYHPQPS